MPTRSVALMPGSSEAGSPITATLTMPPACWAGLGEMDESEIDAATPTRARNFLIASLFRYYDI